MGLQGAKCSHIPPANSVPDPVNQDLGLHKSVRMLTIVLSFILPLNISLHLLSERIWDLFNCRQLRSDELLYYRVFYYSRCLVIPVICPKFAAFYLVEKGDFVECLRSRSIGLFRSHRLKVKCESEFMSEGRHKFPPMFRNHKNLVFSIGIITEFILHETFHRLCNNRAFVSFRRGS